MEAKKLQKVAKKYYCEKCDYTTSRLSSYNKHLTTAKHLGRQKEAQKLQKVAEKYNCEYCDKTYVSRGSLWKHTQKCMLAHTDKVDPEKKSSDKEDIGTLTKLFVEQQQENNKRFEQQHKLIEKLSDNIGSKTINNINNVNTINMNYNVNVFLNDQCKDAINLGDFVNNVQCQLKDLENVGKIGYVDGISQIFIDNLSVMDVDKRPIHCTDLKRKSMYIKDNNEWKKDENNTEVKKAINIITKKNIDNIDKWRLLHMKSPHDSNQSRYTVMCNESLSTDDDGKQKEKILKNIGDAVPLDKSVIKTTIEEISMDEKIE